MYTYRISLPWLSLILFGVQLREGRKTDLEEHVKAVNALLREQGGALDNERSDGSNSEKEEWQGITELEAIDHEDEYIDEDRHTTVTVEAVDVTRDGFKPIASAEAENSDEGEEVAKPPDTKAQEGRPSTRPDGKRIWTKEKPNGPKKKKKKFRYESKAERKVTRMKERYGNKAKAKARKEET